MLKARIVRVGNSRGIRIPKAVLEQTGLAGQVELLVQGHQLVIRPAGSTASRESVASLAEQSVAYRAEVESPNQLTSVRGVYRQGRVDLMEQPDKMPDETPVIVTFIEARPIELRQQGISKADAAKLRSRLSTFAEDWDSPEMSIYDHCDAAKAEL